MEAVLTTGLTDFDLAAPMSGFLVTREEVEDAHAPEPTPTWTPIPHHEAFDMVVGALRGHGIGVVGASHALARNDRRYFALIEVLPEKPRGPEALEYTQIVGIRNSHDKSFNFGFAAGAGVYACSNLSFSGYIEVGKRRTKFFDQNVDDLLDKAVLALQKAFRVQDERFELYKTTDIQSDAVLNDLLVKLYEAGAFPITNLPHIKAEYMVPSSQAFARYGDSVWRLFNAVTLTRKGSDIFFYADATKALEYVLDKYSGFESN